MKNWLLPVVILVSLNAHAQICIHNTSSLKFNGNNDYVQINSNTNLNIDSAITVEAWIKPSAFGFNHWDNSIFCKHSWSTGEQGYVLRCGANGQLSFNFAGFANGLPTSWKDIISGDTVLKLNTWQHVAGTFDGYRMRLFVNGIMVADSVFAGSIVAGGDYNPCIGRLCDFGSFETRYFKGKIDEVRVWNRALDQDEIIQNMSVHLDPSQETGLVGYWRLNDSTGQSVADWSVNANSGTKNGAAWQLDDVPFDNAATVPTITQSGDLLISSHSSEYQWYLDGGAINGATDQTYLTSLSGYYYVQITDSIGCSATSDTMSIIPTGIFTSEDSHFTLLGNPVSDVLTVQMSSPAPHASLRLSNCLGQVVYANEFSGYPARISIDVSNLPQGIYWAILFTDGTLMKQKVIVQR